MSITTTAAQPAEYVHLNLHSGVEFAADVLPQRQTVAICFRILTGLRDEPLELTGINSIVERTLSKGTRRFDGRGLADAFDALGASWTSLSGRQTTLVRTVCLPEFVSDVIDLVGEMVCHPTFPDEACDIAVELAQQELRRMQDEPDELLRLMVQRLTLGPQLGRYPGGEPETLQRINPRLVREHWQKFYHPGRMQVAAAGPVDAEALAALVDSTFAQLGDKTPAGRDPVEFDFQPKREHQHKDLEQEYIGITLPGLARTDERFPVEQVLLRVLAGGMSGRLFTEVREKLGLVYWVGAWHEQPRGRGIIHLGASTTPERCQQTYGKLLSELARLGEDLTDAEVIRARDGLIAHYETEDDLTRARAAALSDDLFHLGRPRGLASKLDAIRAVTRRDVENCVHSLPRDQLCVASLGPRPL